MKQLKFFAKGDLLVRVPGNRPVVGQAPKYVGRRLDNMKNPAVADPFVCDEESDIGRRLKKLMNRENSLIPADEYTAKVCGLKFVDSEFKDGVFVEKFKQIKKD